MSLDDGTGTDSSAAFWRARDVAPTGSKRVQRESTPRFIEKARTRAPENKGEVVEKSFLASPGSFISLNHPLEVCVRRLGWDGTSVE